MKTHTEYIFIILGPSLVAQLVKNPPAIQETLILFVGWEDPWRRDGLPTSIFLGFPCGSAGKESTCNAGDLGSITFSLGENFSSFSVLPNIYWPHHLDICHKNNYLLVKSSVSEVRQPGFVIWFCCLLAGHLWPKYSLWLTLSFLSYKYEITIVLVLFV